MCRFNENRKDQCIVEWFDPENEPLDVSSEQTDLVLKNANFDEHMGLYSCRICCENQCQTLTSFVYPVRNKKKRIALNEYNLLFLLYRLQRKNKTKFCFVINYT